MPLTDFQREVLAVILANRFEASHFADGLVLNATTESPRFSKDFDFFHDAVEALAEASERDAAALRSAGYEVIPDASYGSWDTLTSFRRADVRRGADHLSLDWAHDTAWRFFPIVHDPVLGWRLHLFDMAVNKAWLSQAGRRLATTWTFWNSADFIRWKPSCGRPAARTRDSVPCFCSR